MLPNVSAHRWAEESLQKPLLPPSFDGAALGGGIVERLLKRQITSLLNLMCHLSNVQLSPQTACKLNFLKNFDRIVIFQHQELKMAPSDSSLLKI